MTSNTKVYQIRESFASALRNEQFTVDKSGQLVIEFIGACFEADDETIFGSVNDEYVKRELQWYDSMSLNVNDIEGGAPTGWKAVADKDGNINSNYGWMIYSNANGIQYYQVLNELKENTASRRASMIYQRPSMWYDYNDNGKNDFVCTNAVSYYIRDQKLHAVVQMRSNDIIWGYRNDYAWQKEVLKRLCADYNITANDEISTGKIIWQVQNLHIYERHFYLVHHYDNTLKKSISLQEYRNLYPTSRWCN